MKKTQQIEIAKKVFDETIKSLKSIQENLDETFCIILKKILACKGKVILCGMGKSGHVARKISATMASLGTTSFFLHPAEAMHGDLGMVSSNDIVVLISNSGETSEIIQLLPSLKVIGAELIGITGKSDSTLARECDVVQILEIEKEACALNLAPTTSTTATLVYGDALAVTASIETGFGASDFGLFHPAGALGKRVLIKVKDIMAKGEDIPFCYVTTKITDAIVEMSKKGLGVVAIVDKEMKLVGLLTDGDLRRAMEKKVDLYDDVVETIMTQKPKYINEEILLVDALQKLKENHLNNYPIIDENYKLIGMITWQMIIREGIVL